MGESTVLSQDQGRVRILTLNRPQRLNALNEALRDDLTAALEAAGREEGVGAVVITGAGRAFSAGGDLGRFYELAKSGDQAAQEAYTDVAFPRTLAGFAKPMIAAINGVAVGWGFTLPLLCDIRLASTAAVFRCGFVRIGVTPEFGSSALLPRIIGLGRAMELVLTAREVPAAEALGMGLVSELCEPAALLPRAVELAARIAGLPGPAVRMAKALMRQGGQVSLDAAFEHEMTCFRRAMTTPQHLGALEAMMEAIGGSKGG